TGCGVTFYSPLPYIRLLDHDSNADLVDVTQDFIGKYVQSANTGLQAKILTTYPGNETNFPFTNRLYVKFTNSGTYANGVQAQTFGNNETLYVYDGTVTANVVTQTVTTYSSNTNPTYPAYIGTVNGAGNRSNPPNNNTVKDENYIAVSSPWTSDTAPLLLVTFAELKFIEAEAALSSNPTRAYAAYLAGIGANMDKLQVPAADKASYLANPAVAVGAAGLTKALIFKEKYVATYLNPEAWNDARRNNYQYKDFTLPANAALSTFIRRVAYPSGETTKNGANVPAAVNLDVNLWWDKP
ncbi:MAG: hypothetical protein EOO07_19895, partial [Chitinophagaceae bacterium]